MIDITAQIILFIVAIIANGLSAMAGGGAGLLQLPALIFLGLTFSTALATHKIASVALGLGATVRHSKQGNMSWSLLILVCLTGVPGVILGANIILLVPENMAKILLGILTIGLGIYSMNKKQLGMHFCVKNRSLLGYGIGGIGLFFFGFLNGSLTSGTGLFVTLWLISWFGLDYKRAIALTMLSVGIGWNASGALTLSLLTTAQYDWLPALILGSLIGGYLGSHIAITKGNTFIKRLFELVTLATGIALILNAL